MFSTGNSSFSPFPLGNFEIKYHSYRLFPEYFCFENFIMLPVPLAKSTLEIGIF